jgi:hypothetical protein
MKKNGNLCVLVLAVLVLLTSCASEDQIPEAIPTQPVCQQGGPKELIMQVTEDTLRKMQFVIEKNDLQAGLIRTKRLRGGQFFEPWRTDNASISAKAESNMHSISRTVQIDVYQGSNSLWCIKCTSHTQRLSIPQVEVYGFSRASETFTDSDTAMQTLRLESDELTWIDLGPDPDLERRILDRILSKFGVSVSGQQQ